MLNLEKTNFEIIGVNCENLDLKSNKKNNIWNFELINHGSKDAKIDEIILFKINHNLHSSTKFYGEGRSKLSQYQGNLRELANISPFSDFGLYKATQKDGFFTVYNMLMFFTDASQFELLGFTSCNHFQNELRFNDKELEVVLKLENTTLKAGETIQLESFTTLNGKNREELLSNFADEILKNHPKLDYYEIPTGWCSWYCYGPDATEQDILDNMEIIKNDLPELKYIQIDDGYQNRMGDWLIINPLFPSGVKELCLKIKEAGLEPAIWVAPFIAEKDSELFKNHPDWFVKHETEERPLCSNERTFGGWRRGPWYMLDTTNLEAQNYLKNVFHVMRHEWQCRYFKLDANMWGAMPFGRRSKFNATSVDTYRLGMKAILEGAGEDSFLLGCNAPLWTSLGTVHGMRVSMDIVRTYGSIIQLKEENLHRNWQHLKFWINDPDATVLANESKKQIMVDGSIGMMNSSITDNEFIYHATVMLATGGMVLSGDKLALVTPERRKILQKLVAYRGTSAKFEDADLNIGKLSRENQEIIVVFNSIDGEAVYLLDMPRWCTAKNFWSGEDLNINGNKLRVVLQRHSAIAISITK